MRTPLRARMSASRPFKLHNRYSFAVVLTATIIFSGLAANAKTAQPTTPKTITINRDLGGSVYQYAWQIAKAAQNGFQVRLRGECASACTLYLSMPKEQVCVTSAARFSFHLPYGSSTSANRQAAEYMMNKYPQWVRDWITRRGGLSHNSIRMGGRYASLHMQTCGSSSAPVGVATLPAVPSAVTKTAKSRREKILDFVASRRHAHAQQVAERAALRRQDLANTYEPKRLLAGDR